MINSRAALCRVVTGEETEMIKAITRAMLTGTMDFTCAQIKTGKRIVAFAESWEVNEADAPGAGFAEMSVWRVGSILTAAGEHLELGVNWCAMRLGYYDGEISGMAAWPCLAR
jgi:hypothetical protein